MAIVLPQGRFNNSSDKNIRDFIAERCRILAVVGLHGNTFKPHTGTKTSVLFVQKWNDDPKVGALCPRQDDYNIFFATMRKSGKDNSGEKMWRKISSSSSPPDDELGELMPPSPMQRVVGVEGDFLQDVHGHLVVDHDLYNHEGQTEDGIAEAFIEFAKKENLSFFESSPSVTPFDAVRYQQLMDGLEAVELQLSYVIQDSDKFRFDSDYFQKEFLAALKAVQNYQLLGQYVKFGYRVVYETTEIIDAEEGKTRNCPIFLQATDITTPFIETGNLFYVDEADWIRYPQGRIKKGELLIEVKGKAEKISIVPDDFSEKVLVTGSLYKLTVNNDINRYYLLIYLITKYGIAFRNRYKSNLLISFISKHELYSIPIPSFSTRFQVIIESIFRELSRLRNLSNEIYQEAENLLLSELALKDWQPTKETVAVKSFAESFLSSSRLDAEYYQPKFDQLIERLEEKVELTPLGDLLTLNQRGKQPQYIEDEDEYELGLPVVNSRHVREGEVILTDNRYAYLPENDNPLTIQTDDVLINGTGIGTIGRCAPYLYEQEALPDNHVTILRTDLLDPVYLSIYLNSIIGKLFVEKHFKGSSGQIELYPNEIVQFLIWDAPDSVQQKIRSKVEVSHQKREQSKQLLEIAKTGVERAIETDEAIATAWINQQLEALGINLTATT